MQTRSPLAALAVSALLAQLSLRVAAQTTEAPVLLEKVLVSVEQPGPGMWKVSKGDNLLWIVGVQSPMLKKVTWRAKKLESIVAQSQEILDGPSVSVGRKQIGFFTALTLIPAAMEARKNPNGATLRDVVPAEYYQRWEVLRNKYVGQYSNDEESDIERWRPMFAAFELYSKAIDKSGMTFTSPVWPLIRDTAKKHNVKITEVKLEPPINEPRKAINQLKATTLADLECFTKTIERIETDLDLMKRRANAWAVGDVSEMRKLPASDQRAACESAIRDTSFLKTLGIDNIEAQLTAMWLGKIDTALTNNKVTLTTMSIRQLTGADGYLAKLKARGYTVVEPEDTED